MWRTTKPSAENQGRSGPVVLRRVHLARGQTPTCCDRPMQPQLAQTHDRLGHNLFLTIWRCAGCGRAVY